ncbi:PIR protein [Plasmodium ovale]|uniref:PIR protein n=1 Tax=Plasmodium ovale TaxID=36330 RepID=A0A1D3JEU8_PLAOA|nr:PIR protein [Plasmodium ovale]
MITQCNKGSDLPSCKIYEQFNQENGNSGKFTDACNKIQGRFGHKGIFDLCIKLGNNLLNFCSNDEKSNPLDYSCEFINYWLFGEIFNNLKLTETGELNGVKSQFSYTWKNIVEGLECKKKCGENRKLFSSIPINDLKFRKIMHDYIYNYDNFENITSSENICNKISIYLPSMREKYAKIKDSCPHSSNKCFHDAKSFEEYNPEKLCKKFQCKDEPLCSNSFDETQEQSDPGKAGSYEEGKGADSVDGEAVASVDESKTSTILTTVGPSFLGLFITSFFLFKLTPIRSWISNRILRRKNIEEYMDEKANNEMVDNYFLHENGEPGKSRYDIAYHSVENIGD